MRQSTYTPSQFEGYSLSVDILNILACVAVIFLHVNGAVWAFSYERYWTTSLVIECVFFLAVPVFFLLSGATLMDYRQRYNGVPLVYLISLLAVLIMKKIPLIKRLVP